MTAVDLDALDKLREAATPGPWEKLLDTDAEPHICAGNTYVAGAFDDPADAALIVAAANALPDLIAEARKYRALREAVEEKARQLDGMELVVFADRLRAVVATVDGEQ